MDNKIAVVVGGTGQIGASVVEGLKADDYFVICIAREASNVPILADEFLYGDMTKPGAVEEICKTVFANHEKVNLLVNAIGKNIKCSLAGINEEIWQEVIDSNLKSVFFICRTFTEYMQRNGGGTIINFSSTAGIRPLLQSPHYIAAKAGVIAISEFFAKVYAPHIRVNCIAPGFILTENHLPENYASYNDVVDRIPMGMLSSVPEIVKSILYLARSPTVTGHTLVIDGGLIL
jgi:NAD(P)-dependent dehydrogenase (short-subunit alcohol dehydrogenase family)